MKVDLSKKGSEKAEKKIKKGRKPRKKRLGSRSSHD